ncbi:MAG: DUF3817 domain-containing protein [Polyangiaceae bacterium]|nr:DUF3817 domain-containing protein [Polyangiaceae bacterium]
MGTFIAWVRIVGYVEAVSFLALVGVGMPLKYLAEQPTAVKVLGPIHGGLFLALGALALVGMGKKKLSSDDAGAVIMASLLPAGPFFIDKRLKKLEA